MEAQPLDAPERARRIEAHLPLVRTLALRFARRGEPLDDLVQAGCIGLIHAVDRHDPARGAFEAYAVPTITGEIRRHLRDRGSVLRVPPAVLAESGRPRLDPLGDDDGPRADPIAAVDARLTVAAALRTLPWHERRVVLLWLYGERSQRSIAAEVGISQIHVSRLLRRGLERLRRQLEDGHPLPAPPRKRRFAP
jgi:RNA polymerase sigma-B factor